jgi:solute carrier family 13 (sodium-dependent dicarboxylate transporter), member 2/3/5
MITSRPGRRSALPSAGQIGFVLGPAIALATATLLRPTGLDMTAPLTAGIILWMLIWWATEAVPAPVTGFLPLVLFPLIGVMSFETTAQNYAQPVIYLFLGGSVVMLAVQRSGLHLRMALAVFRLVGSNASVLIGTFMLTSALISMWVSNTATTLMLLPIAMSVIQVMRESRSDTDGQSSQNFQCALLLGLAYSTAIGGLSTLVGTPTNAFMSGFVQTVYGTRIGFAQWMMIGVPVMILMLPICWGILTQILFPVRFRTSRHMAGHLARLRSELGPWSRAEYTAGSLFIILITAWVLREPISVWTGFNELTDAGVAMMVAVVAFILPGGHDGFKRRRLVTWDDMRDLPWGIFILFGGGFALAAGLTSSGLTQWASQSLGNVRAVPLPVLVMVATSITTVMSEFTSNVTTVASMLPIAASVAEQSGVGPLMILIPITIAASLGFMFPISTPPNMIVYSTGYVPIRHMLKAGLILNIVGIALTAAFCYVLVPIIFI